MASTPSVTVYLYKRSYLVIGPGTFPLKDKFKEAGLKWNGTLDGWIVGKTVKGKVDAMLGLVEQATGSRPDLDKLTEFRRKVIYTLALEVPEEIGGEPVKEHKDGKINTESGKAYVATAIGWVLDTGMVSVE